VPILHVTDSDQSYAMPELHVTDCGVDSARG
jgi:hypothetical protein